MKKILIICAAAALTGCGIYKPYTRPEVTTAGLYGSAETADTTTLGDIRWQEMFTDPQLQALIALALENNTDLLSAGWRVKEAEATLKSARLAYLPSFNFAPQGSLSSFDGGPTAKTYSIPVTASWQIDIFNGLTNAKRKAKALYAQSKEYEQAVKTQLISGVANLYYTLLMLDSQYEVTEETAAKWRQSVEAMRALKEAGYANEAGVAQYEANTLAIEASLHDLGYQRTQAENSLCSLLGEVPHTIARGRLENQQLPDDLTVGVPLLMLSNRPDVRSAEYSLMQSYYATASARSALYPSITLSGTVGWTNNSGAGIVNPGKLIWNAAGSLLQPIFNANANRARVKIAKAQQEESKLSFQQTLLNAGAEVNNALTQCQSARAKADLRERQIEALERAVESTELLMQHGSTTYLEVLTAQQSLLSAQLSQIADRAVQAQVEDRAHQLLGKCRGVDFGQQKLFLATGFEVVGQFPAPEFPVLVVVLREDDLAADVRQETVVYRIEVVDVFVRQPEHLLQRIAAAPFAAGDDAFPLLVAHGLEACAYEVILVGEHFVQGAFRDSQRLRDLIDPDGTDAVPGDKLLRSVDDLLFGHSPFHYFSSVMSRPPPRAW